MFMRSLHFDTNELNTDTLHHLNKECAILQYTAIATTTINTYSAVRLVRFSSESGKVPLSKLPFSILRVSDKP